jgi:hypothetical protein
MAESKPSGQGGGSRS